MRSYFFLAQPVYCGESTRITRWSGTQMCAG